MIGGTVIVRNTSGDVIGCADIFDVDPDDYEEYAGWIDTGDSQVYYYGDPDNTICLVPELPQDRKGPITELPTKKRPPGMPDFVELPESPEVDLPEKPEQP